MAHGMPVFYFYVRLDLEPNGVATTPPFLYGKTCERTETSTWHRLHGRKTLLLVGLACRTRTVYVVV